MSKTKTTLLASCAIFAVTTFGSYKLGFHYYRAGVETAPGQISYHDRAFMDDCARAKVASLLYDPVGVETWSRCQAVMDYYGTQPAFNRRLNLVAAFSGLSVISLIAFLWIVKYASKPPKVVRGREHFKGAKARRELKKISRKECKQSGQGIEFPLNIPMSLDRESRHFLAWGSTGAGKTTAMLLLMLGAIHRGDKVLILDTKGDLTSKLPYIGGVIAPHDARSLKWDIAYDCRTPQEARELAARIIPASGSDPMWSNAAREIFVACIVSLQNTRPECWNWKSLRDLVLADPERLLEVAESHYPAATQFLREPTSKTTQSILTTFKSHMNIVLVLADAWPRSSGGFSIRRWLDLPNYAPIVLQRDGKFSQLSKAWLSGIIGLLASYAGSPAMRENPDTRTWLFLDEFPQLERMDHFSTLLDVGRSKGIRVVLGAQDLSQIRKTYGPDQANAWIGMIGTHIITRMNLGESAEMTSRLLGKQTVEVERKSETRTNGQRSTSKTPVKETQDVMTPSELSDHLGVTKNGIRALMVGPGQHAYDVDIPFLDLPEQRPASVPADWTTKCAKDLVPLPERNPLLEERPILSPDMADFISRKAEDGFDA
ncbi:MAG: type IV secretion system DNA-binding domain-containing protein [Hyphomonadaceae bacterium]|nr:type IV secretion system DNA-binding domain-containing protein [Hyphomonadaceae bacterium]